MNRVVLLGRRAQIGLEVGSIEDDLISAKVEMPMRCSSVVLMIFSRILCEDVYEFTINSKANSPREGG